MTTQEINPYDAPLSDVSDSDGYGEAKVLSFSGRIGRLRYLAYSVGLGVVVTIVGGMMIGLVAAMTPQDDAELGALTILITVIVYAIMIVGSVVLAIRRLNDFDASGWLVLLLMVPVANVIISLILWFKPGSSGKNRYGMPPPANSGGVTALALVMPLLVIIGILAAIAIPQYADYQQRAAAMQGQHYSNE